jgi:hypothetical protein
MTTVRYITLLLTAASLVAAASWVTIQQAAAAPQDKEAAIRANLAKLPESDRKAAEAQKYCAVETDDRLGAMGVPVKIVIRNQPVFLCCKGCVDQAKKDPDKMLATVKELQAKARAEDKK